VHTFAASAMGSLHQMAEWLDLMRLLVHQRLCLIQDAVCVNHTFSHLCPSSPSHVTH
jgi:hypothetical protein